MLRMLVWHCMAETCFFLHINTQFLLYCAIVARSPTRMQESRFQIYLAQQHVEDIVRNRFVLVLQWRLFCVDT